MWCSYHFLLSIYVQYTCRDLCNLLDPSILLQILNYIMKLSVGTAVPLFWLGSATARQSRRHRVTVPRVKFDNLLKFVLTGLFNPLYANQRSYKWYQSRLPLVRFTTWGMEPRGGSSGVKPIDVDLKDVSLHDTDSSELSASTVSNTTLL